MKDYSNVIIPSDMIVAPEIHEIQVAWILARHNNCIIEFLKPINSYKTKTADFVMNGLIWELTELKSPTGSSKKHTIKRQFFKAKGKRQNLIIDRRRTKLEDGFLLSKISYELKQHRSIRKLLYITKNEKIGEIK